MNEPGHTLTVWIGDQVAGHLHHHPTTNRFAFAYADAWREARGAFALGPQLPLKAPVDQSPDQHSAIVRQFFENLLPEGDALDHAAQAHGVSKSNLLGLIHALGRETTGAIRLTVSDVAEPVAPSEEHLREVNRQSQNVAQERQHPSNVAPRLEAACVACSELAQRRTVRMRQAQDKRNAQVLATSHIASSALLMANHQDVCLQEDRLC